MCVRDCVYVSASELCVCVCVCVCARVRVHVHIIVWVTVHVKDITTHSRHLSTLKLFWKFIFTVFPSISLWKDV